MFNLEPTLILTNGKFWTMNDGEPEAEAVAIYDKDIVAVGKSRDIESMAGASTNVIDLDGRVAIPGLQDIHVHLAMDAMDAKAVEVRDYYDSSIKSVKDILKKIETRVSQIDKGKWIHANGSPMQDFRLAEKRFPTKEELDKVSPNNPCYVNFGAHISVANSLALKAAGITKESKDPEGGWIIKDEAGEPNGVLRERAQFLVNTLDDSKLTALEDGIEQLLKRVASRGVTVVHDVVTSAEEINAYQNLCNAGRMPVRVQLLIRIIEAKITTKSLVELGFTQRFGNDMLKIGGSKMSIDGGFTGRQAAFSGMKGLVRIQQEELDETVMACHLAGIRCCVHAIGDIAVDMTLSSFEKAQKRLPLPDIRHRVEHMGNWLFTSERRKKSKQLGAVPVTNGSLFYFVADSGEAYIGEERNRGLFPIKTMQKEGLNIASGSDATLYWPVDVIRDIAAYVNRKTVMGTLMGPEEAISFREGVRAQTKDASWVGCEENRAGTIEKGKIADLTVFDRNPDECPPEELKDLPIMMTVCAGRVSFRKE